MNKTLTLALAISAALALSACGGDGDANENVVAPGNADSALTADADDAATDAMADASDAATDDAMDPAAGADPMATDPAAPMPPVEGDPAALGVLNMVNEHEIAASQMALDSGVDGAVADYARQMIEEHGMNRDQTAALGPDPAAPAAQAMAAKGQAKRDALSAQAGDAFEQAYVQQMIADHTEALATLDDVLIPAATAEPVKAHLQTTRGHVAHHLELAQGLDAN